MDIRVGTGYDVHRVSPNRKFVLGGVTLPASFGLDGHSDADVLAHAIIDALFGACALGDIGRHFPDTDEAYRGADSMILLEKCVSLVRESGYVISNIDSTVICQSFKLAPYIESIRAALAAHTGTDVSRISVKAKTNEHLDSLGRGECVAAQAVALVIKKEN